MLKFNDSEFEETAKALFLLNDAVLSSFETPTDLVNFMKNRAYEYLHDENCSFFGTYGFYLSAYDTPDYRQVRATISPFLVTAYLGKQKESRMQHWFSPTEMPESLRTAANQAGMWEDDISNIWFVPRGMRSPKEINEISARHGGPSKFIVDSGIVFVDYHA